MTTMPGKIDQCTIMKYAYFIIEHNLNLLRIKLIISFLKCYDSLKLLTYFLTCLLTYCSICRCHVGYQRTSISAYPWTPFQLSHRYCLWTSSLLQYSSMCLPACHACSFLLECNVVQSYALISIFFNHMANYILCNIVAISSCLQHQD